MSNEHTRNELIDIDASVRGNVEEMRRFRENWKAILKNLTDFSEERIAEIMEKLTSIAHGRLGGSLSSERIAEIVEQLTRDALLRSEGDSLGLFFHETSAYWLAPYLVPPRIAKCLTVLGISHLECKIEAALGVGEIAYGYGDGYDWEAARKRINTILTDYEHTLY